MDYKHAVGSGEPVFVWKLVSLNKHQQCCLIHCSHCLVKNTKWMQCDLCKHTSCLFSLRHWTPLMSLPLTLCVVWHRFITFFLSVWIVLLRSISYAFFVYNNSKVNRFHNRSSCIRHITITWFFSEMKLHFLPVLIGSAIMSSSFSAELLYF